MDQYMPEIEGRDLGAVIRQEAAVLSIPIVFLSAESDPDKQLELMQIGADEFLTKSISPERLLTAINILAERFRHLRSMMLRDRPTGLLNHTTTKKTAQHRAFAHAAWKYALDLRVDRPRPFQVGERYLLASDRRPSSKDHVEYAQTALVHDGLDRPIWWREVCCGPAGRLAKQCRVGFRQSARSVFSDQTNLCRW